MKKFEAHVAQGKLAKSQKSVGEKLEAPVVLTPEQLEIVAAGFFDVSATIQTILGRIIVAGGIPAGPIPLRPN
jgi:hypothetical protein